MNDRARTRLREVSFSLLSEGRVIRLRADGYSMYPAIRPGSVITIEPYPAGTGPVVGEIAAWGSESGMVVHRLVRISGESGEMLCITRGDSNLYPDPPVKPEDIAGRVVKIEYRGKEKKIKSGRPCSMSYRINRAIIWFIHKTRRITNKQM